MNSTKINLSSGNLFPWYFLLIGGLAIVGGLVLLTSSLVFASICIFIGLLIVTAKSGIIIDPSTKFYRPYYSVLFLKTGKKKPFSAVEKVYVNANKVSQKIYTAHTLQSSTFKDIVYDAYIKFSDGTKSYLLSSKNKDQLLQQLKQPAQLLKTQLIDNTH